jgi:hypothetical protein
MAMPLPIDVLLIVPFLGLLATWTPTDRTKRLLDALEAAARRAGLPKKAVAAAQGLSEQRWQRQLALRDNAHPSLARAGELPDDVLLHFADEICTRIGGARVVRDAQLISVMAALDRIQVRMARMELHDDEQEREVS